MKKVTLFVSWIGEGASIQILGMALMGSALPWLAAAAFRLDLTWSPSMKPKKNTISTASELLSKLSCTTAGEMPFLEDELWNPGDALPEKLRVRWFALRDRKSFQPGDLVTWKPGLQNRIYPKLGAPAIVVQVLETCRHDTEKNSGSTYFNEPLDLILGVVLDDGSHEGDFFTWHFDSRRFMHWKKEN